MYPEEGVVAIFDANAGRRELFIMELTDSNYQILRPNQYSETGIEGEINTKEKALQLVPHLGALGVKVALIDTDLELPETEATSHNNSIERRIHETYENEVKTIHICENPDTKEPTKDIAMNDNVAEIIKNLHAE